jgi:hypothetical protein
LLDKLPTREAFFNKDLITNQLEKCCVFGFEEVENIYHFFLQAKVWRLIFNWMGSKIQVCDNVSPHFLAFGDLCKGKNS